MHLHIVLTDPIAATGDVLIVSVTSIPPSNLYDSSCTFFPDEHPFIVKHSYVAYRFCKVVSAADLEARVVAGEFVAKQSLSGTRLDDATEGLKASPHVTPKIRRFFDAAQ
ncbi:MAG TPA: hypothetical protein VLI72_09230 [Methylibium sp.]|nr:hypothetical protein [Methylibium sp.]